MRKKALVFLSSFLLVFLSANFVILRQDAAGATTEKKLKKRHIFEDIRLDGSERDFDRPRPQGMSRYPATGVKYDLSCTDIDPEIGQGFIVQHDEIGDTWYDFQQNGSMGRMISVTPEGYRHFSWMFADGPYPGAYRYVDANCKNPVNEYLGQVHVDGGQYKNAGYSNQTHLHDGRSVVVYHRTAGQLGDPMPASMLSIEDSLCAGDFNRHWDIPDSIRSSCVGGPGEWPKLAALYDAVEQRDYIHVVVNEFSSAGCGLILVTAYQRCFLGEGDTLVCQSYADGATMTYHLAANVNYSAPSKVVGSLDSTCGVTAVPVVSPVSRRVTVAFIKPACDGTCDYMGDIAFVESMSNGDDWIDGSNYPPPEHNVTDYGCGYPEDYRANSDLSACYDYNDSLHIVWCTVGFPEPGYYQPGLAHLWHWSKCTGAAVVTSAVWGGTDQGMHNANIAKMSIAARDAVFNPGGEPDAVYLFCIWTQFDTNTSVGGAQDNSDVGYTNGELYGVGSNDGGLTWGHAWNLTQTHTPACTPGSCVSEHWSSLAQNMYDADLHIQYICDRHPGSAISGQDAGSAWVDNPVMYLDLETEWGPGCPAPPSYTLIEPTSWHRPPLKVSPGGSRNLTMKLTNYFYCPTIPYSVTSDHPCVQISAAGVLLTSQTVTVNGVVDGSGQCEGTFIQGTVTITLGSENFRVPVHAVVAEDYYECPVDPATFDTVETSALRLYANANSLEWIHDISSYPDTVHEVAFQGGSFVATATGDSVAVGRWYGDNDWRSGVRDKLYYSQCEEGDTLCHLLYTKNIFIHYPPSPPYNFHDYWYWWEWSKMIKVCELPDNEKIVIKYIRVQRHDPPTWWPENDQLPYATTGHEDTYVGMMMDFDCPYDTMGNESARNEGGYDAMNQIAWQRGYDYTGAHPSYNDYYAGMALADTGSTNPLTPYGAHIIKNNYYLYPQSPWGWKDSEFYALAATAGTSVQDEDSLVDRSVVMTAQHIPAGIDSLADYSFVVIEAFTDNGLADLQSLVDKGRQIVRKGVVSRDYGYPVKCGDLFVDMGVNLGDVLILLNYLFKNQAPPPCPMGRADTNSDGIVNVGDALRLLNYLFKGGPPPTCPGIW